MKIIPRRMADGRQQVNSFRSYCVVVCLVVLFSSAFGGVGLSIDEGPVVALFIDGLDWDLLSTMIATGSTPTLASLLNDGTSAPLISLPQPLPQAVWTSVATGKLPEKHGILSANVVSGSVKVKRLWDILQMFDKPSGIYRYLVSWPPEIESGFMIPAEIDREPKTIPPKFEFLVELNRLAGKYELDNRMQFISTLEKTSEFIGSIEPIVTNLRQSMGKEVSGQEVAMVRSATFNANLHMFRVLVGKSEPALCLFGDQSIQPYYNAFMTEALRHRKIEHGGLDPILNQLVSYIQFLDTMIGHYLETLTKATVLVISTNTLCSTKAAPEIGPYYIIDLNAFLKGHGYDSMPHFSLGPMTYIPTSIFSQSGKNYPTEEEFLRLLNTMRGEDPNVQVVKAESTGVGFTYLTVVAEQPQELKTLKSGDRDLPAQQLLSRIIISDPSKFKGVFAMKGSNIKQGGKLDSVGVCDITPTVLAALGLRVAKDFDGKVLEQVFTSEYLKLQPILYVDTYEGEFIKKN